MSKSRSRKKFYFFIINNELLECFFNVTCKRTRNVRCILLWFSRDSTSLYFLPYSNTKTFVNSFQLFFCNFFFQLLLKKIVHCQQILDKNGCSAYAEMTKKAKRTLAHLEECVRTPGLHRFDDVLDATIEQLLQTDVSFKTLKEEAEEAW